MFSYVMFQLQFSFSIFSIFPLFEYLLRNNLPAASDKLIFNKNSSNILFLQASKQRAF